MTTPINTVRNGSSMAKATTMPMVVMFLRIQSMGPLSPMTGRYQNRTVANVPTILSPTLRYVPTAA